MKINLYEKKQTFKINKRTKKLKLSKENAKAYLMTAGFRQKLTERSLKPFKVLLLVLFILWGIYLISYTINKSYADKNLYNQSFDEKIERFCKEHKLANEEIYGHKAWERCTLIGQAQIRMETQLCTTGMALTRNNCFGLKGRYDTNGRYNVKRPSDYTYMKFINFKSKTDSIKFYVDRYYTWDWKKNITQIVYGYKINGKWMYGFTATDKKHYYRYVKDYFHENYNF